jgi:peptide-methionine (R)-S-oxide reductase
VADKIIKPDSEWKKILSDEQFKILRLKGTEPAFSGSHLLNVPGIYRCVACDNALFSSNAKYNSGTGWPSFWEPISEGAVIIKPYAGEGIDGAEVLCSRCEGHLGHLFLDGPKPTGRRFCINSVVLKLTN